MSPIAPPPASAAAHECLGAYLAATHGSPVAFPSVAMEILELVRFPDVDLNELARYIRSDGALSGGVLALANSAASRAVRRIDTVKDAVARLGISEVARLAAAISMKSLYSADATRAHERFQPVWTRLFLHAVTVGRSTSELAKQKVVITPGVEQTFMAGLLHDVGMAGAMRAVAELTFFGKLPELDDPVLARVLYRVHVEAGVELHKTWQLPPTLADVAARHHDLTFSGEGSALVHLVRLVSAVDLLRRSPASNPRAGVEILESVQVLGLPPARLKLVAGELEKAAAWSSTVFSG